MESSLYKVASTSQSSVEKVGVEDMLVRPEEEPAAVGPR